MNFKERFKGKTSTMSKEGIENLVLTSNKPIKKNIVSSYSVSQLPHLVSSSNMIEISPKPVRKIPLTTTTNTGRHASLFSDLPTPKIFTPTLGTQNHQYIREPDQLEHPKPVIYRPSISSPHKEKTFFRAQASPLRQRERPMNRRSFNVKATKSANQSQLVIDPMVSDQSTSYFNPSTFHNQNPQISGSQRILTDIQKNTRVGLKLNRNHLHQKSFEGVTQQRMVSKEVFKGLYRPDQLHNSHNFNDYSQDLQASFSQKTNRIYDSVLSGDKSGSPTPRRGLVGGSGMYMVFEGNKNSRDNDYFSSNNVVLSSDTKSVGFSLPRTSQLRKLRFQSPRKKDKTVDLSRRENSNEREEFAEMKEVVKLKALPENMKGGYINLGNIIAFKPKTQEGKGKTKDAWRFAVIEANLKV